MKPLRVLITNNTLSYRSGTEMYAKELALALLARGHHPILYSPTLGEVAKELRRKTVPVVDTFAAIGEAPDIIHGHHHFDTINALLHFPNTPALYVCHGWLPGEEMPPHFPRIYKYIAVDDLCLERLVSESGIAKEKTEVLYNFADGTRFLARTPLPEKPSRALIFSNYLKEQTEDINAACSQAGITVDIAGERSGSLSTRPEELLPNYDIVFAKAKAAIEALCVGCAVIVYDAQGSAGMVTPENFEYLRSLNFGVRTLQKPHCKDIIYDEICRYNPTQAAAVSQRIRKEASIDAVIDRLLECYNECISQHSAATPVDEKQAIADYMQNLRLQLRDFSLQANDSILSLHNQTHSLSKQLAEERVARVKLEQQLQAIRASKTIHLRNSILENWLARKLRSLKITPTSS